MSISKGIDSMLEAESDARKFARSYGDTVDSFKNCLSEMQKILKILEKEAELYSSSQSGRKG